MGDRRRIKEKAAKSKRLMTPEESAINYNKLPPIFSFEYLDDDYCVSKCQRDEKASFADTLRIMGKQTWEQLIMTNRHANGTENIPVYQIKGKIPKIVSPDVSNVIAFRFHDKKPVVGHRIDQIFYIIWLDRNRTLYDHG